MEEPFVKGSARYVIHARTHARTHAYGIQFELPLIGFLEIRLKLRVSYFCHLSLIIQQGRRLEHFSLQSQYISLILFLVC